MNNPSFPRKIRFNLLILIILSQHVYGNDFQNEDIEDSRQQTQIATSYALNPFLRVYDIKVKVDQGHVILTGLVSDEITKNLASQIALEVGGILAVENRIVVESTYYPNLGVQRWGDIIDDVTIIATIQNQLRWHQKTDLINTEIFCDMGHVTLSGFADSLSIKEQVGELALNTRGVISVKNNLQIRKSSATDYQKTGEKDSAESHLISDSWITTKVKSSFFFSRYINGLGIRVTTENGVVTLSGIVYSDFERSSAIDISKKIRGVQSVIADDLKQNP